MKSDKNDHRSKYTQMVIKNGLLKLLNDKPLNKITVAELCGIAEINRGTFYNHFYDVFDVYESIENEFYNEVKTKMENIKVYDLDKSFFKEIVLLIYRNIDLVRMIINNKSGSDVLKRLIEFVRNKFINEWSEHHKKIQVSFLKQIFSYMANGSIGAVSDWVQSGMKETLDEVSDLIEKLNDLIINTYLK